MANVAVYNMEGSEVSMMDLNDNVFAVEVNEHLMHMAVVLQLANKRQGTQKAKTRSEVSGGGRKPWRQKGTGHARQGSIRAPQWTGGGIVFAPTPRDYSFKLNKKVKQLARKSALSYKALNGGLMVVEDFSFEAPKTKEFVALLNNLKVSDKKLLLVLPEANKNVYLSARNLQLAKVQTVSGVNTYRVLDAGVVMFTEKALSAIDELLDKKEA